jgi:DNA-3-methyladenine glycosylase
MYECLNIVAEPRGTPGCVLIRALEPVNGIDLMKHRRPGAHGVEDLANGPGKLTLAMSITRSHYGADLTKGSLVVREAAEKARVEILATPRIGITHCADRLLRFVIAANRFVSRVQ